MCKVLGLAGPPAHPLPRGAPPSAQSWFLTQTLSPPTSLPLSSTLTSFLQGGARISVGIPSSGGVRPSPRHSHAEHGDDHKTVRRLTKYVQTLTGFIFSYSCFHVIVLLIVWEVVEEEKQWEGGKLSPEFISCLQPLGCSYLRHQLAKRPQAGPEIKRKRACASLRNKHMRRLHTDNHCEHGFLLNHRELSVLSLSVPPVEDQPDQVYLFQRTCPQS